MTFHIASRPKHSVYLSLSFVNIYISYLPISTGI